MSDQIPHRSFSQVQGYKHCPKQYQLTRIAKAPEIPSWYLVGGKAFHLAIERDNHARWCGYKWIDADEQWADAWAEEMAVAEAYSSVEPEYWRKAGRKTKDKPNGEDGVWWYEQGPAMLTAYRDWLDRYYASGWKIATLPGNAPGIEMEINASFGKVPVKMFIDLLLVNEYNDLLVIDAKTGSKPDHAVQLGWYATGLELTFGVRPTYGAFYMSRDGDITTPDNLDRFTTKLLTADVGMVDTAIKLGIFPASTGRHCGYCGVAQYCHTVGGERALEFDNLARLA